MNLISSSTRIPMEPLRNVPTSTIESFNMYSNENAITDISAAVSLIKSGKVFEFTGVPYSEPFNPLEIPFMRLPPLRRQPRGISIPYIRWNVYQKYILDKERSTDTLWKFQSPEDDGSFFPCDWGMNPKTLEVYWEANHSLLPSSYYTDRFNEDFAIKSSTESCSL